jgi:hypothetical protein
LENKISVLKRQDISIDPSDMFNSRLNTLPIRRRRGCVCEKECPLEYGQIGDGREALDLAAGIWEAVPGKGARSSSTSMLTSSMPKGRKKVNTIKEDNRGERSGKV